MAKANSDIYASVLALNRLEINVRLGVSEEERRTPQPVFIDVKLYFPDLPAAATSDEAGYICYYGISQKIHDLGGAKEYRLIEYFVHEIHRQIRERIPEEVKAGVTLLKPSALLPFSEDGASYRYSDLPPFAWVAPE